VKRIHSTTPGATHGRLVRVGREDLLDVTVGEYDDERVKLGEELERDHTLGLGRYVE